MIMYHDLELLSRSKNSKFADVFFRVSEQPNSATVLAFCMVLFVLPKLHASLYVVVKSLRDKDTISWCKTVRVVV